MTTTPTSGAADLPEARLFTKKPVTIAAIQWTGKNLREVIAFTDGPPGPPDTRTTHAGMAWEAYTDLVARDGLKIYTLEGKMLASPGDWIIRGVKGEYYPCKDEIFEATYSPAALAAGQATAAAQGFRDGVASLTAQAADSVQEDAARLDFLIEQRAYVVSDPDACPGHWLHWAMPDGRTWVQGDEHPTPRAAIDAARKQGEKQ